MGAAAATPASAQHIKLARTTHPLPAHFPIFTIAPQKPRGNWMTQYSRHIYFGPA
jgi:hypothetical protein